MAGQKGYPRHFAAASLKPSVIGNFILASDGYPRHFAAASLKHQRTAAYV